ncbi:MAG: DUF5696 domain-containing protein [Isosphaeraceae bacterium]
MWHVPTRRLAHALALVLSASAVFGFDPPVDRAGPLRARIEGPTTVTRTGTPIPVAVVLENRGDQPLSGTVTLGVIDHWTAQPDKPVRFEVAGKGTARVAFTVTADASTLDAHYPIHAYARFTDAGRTLTAHPILIVPTHVGAPSRVRTAPARGPYVMASDARLGLWYLPAHQALFQVFGRSARLLERGREVDEETGATIAIRSQDLGGERREVVAIHPPWRDGKVGTAVLEFPVVLPAGGPLTLHFQNAVADDGHGDGVTFRVRVAPIDAPDGQLGEVVFERHSAAKRWGTAGEADLSKYAGKAVRIQLESHPGPKNDTGWDQSYWSEPTLVAGNPPAEAPFPPRDVTGSIVLGKATRGKASTTVRLWPGSRGLLDSVIGFERGGTTLHVRGFQVRVLGSRIDDPRSPFALVSTQVKQAAGTYNVRHHFKGPDGTFDLVGTLELTEGVVRAKFRLENEPAPRPWRVAYLEDVALGSFSRKARQVYAGFGNVVRDPAPFVLNFDGHQLSTSFIGLDFDGGLSLVQGVNVPPDHFQVAPAARHYSIHAPHAQTITLIPAAGAFDAARLWHDVNRLKAAGGVTTAAGRFVFDLWGGRYADNDAGLKRAFRYGLGNSMVVYHDWQRWGYDYRLPDIYPPSPRPGTEAELKALIATCKSAGTRFALHDNYIDFYPDADEFSYEKNIAFDAAGRPVKAWFNEGRDAQSYRYRADRAERYLKRNLGLIKANLAPTAYFIDVWSSAGPYDYWRADGTFGDRVATRTTWGELFAWIRQTLGDHAPQISESGHDQLIGWLDGAQTNHLRVGQPIPGRPGGWTVWNWKCADAERTPWYDTAHHDRFVLHGAGYPGRYEGGLDPREHGIYSDDYMATEVLTGHPAMVSHAFGQDVVRQHWLLNDLMRALALRRIESVEYVGGDLHRQHVRWSGGGEVWVNRGSTDWTVGGGRILPQYGFLALAHTEEGTVEAAVELRNGLIVESSRSPRLVYVNARGNADGRARITPAATAFRATGGRELAVAVTWHAEDPIPPGYVPFYHFCDGDGAIAFQGGSEPLGVSRQGTIRTVVRATVPESVKPGESFELRAGLYNPKHGPRLELTGPGDREARIQLGKVSVKPGGLLSWTPQPRPKPARPTRANSTGKAVDFGTVATSGGVRVAAEGRAITVTPLPDTHGRRLKVRLHLSALPGSRISPSFMEAVSEDGRTIKREPLRAAGDVLSLTFEPGVFQYRLTAD